CYPRESPPRERGYVDPGGMGATADRHAVRDHVALKTRHTSNNGVSTNPSKLNDCRPDDEAAVVPDRAVPSQHDVVGEHDVVADAAIVADMRVGKKCAVVPDDRFEAPTRCPRVHRDALADEAVRADRQLRWLALVLQVLGLMADRGEGKDARVRADRRMAGHDDMADQLAAITTGHLRPDEAGRAALHAGPGRGAGYGEARGSDLRASRTGTP